MPAEAAKLRLLSYGEFTFDSSTPAPDSGQVTGNEWITGVRFIRPTTEIAGELCNHFGIEFGEDDQQPAPLGRLLTVRLTHPVLHNPNGRSGTVEVSTKVLTAEPMMSGFGFDFAWEIAPGPWTFAVLAGDDVLLEQTFQVMPPSSGLSTSARCEAHIS